MSTDIFAEKNYFKNIWKPVRKLNSQAAMNIKNKMYAVDV